MMKEIPLAVRLPFNLSVFLVAGGVIPRFAVDLTV
jgi:hypothetical protein